MIIQLDEAKRTLLAMKDDVKELASALKIEKIKDSLIDQRIEGFIL